MEHTYWNKKGRHQNLYDKLQAKMPLEGKVKNLKKNGNLEALREASIAYYDIHNNGGGNVNNLIRKHFGVYDKGKVIPGVLFEEKMNGLILRAAEEQNMLGQVFVVFDTVQQAVAIAEFLRLGNKTNQIHETWTGSVLKQLREQLDEIIKRPKEDTNGS